MAVMKRIAMTVQAEDATSLTGAPSHEEEGWHDLDWKRAHRNVRRLQARIAKATQEGRWGKVKALQRLLTRSFSAKALAVKRVTENRGKRTAGVDRELWLTPASKMRAVRNLRPYGYKAQPLRRIYIPKKSGKGRRPLSIPTMYDRAMQALYRLALDPVAETTGDPNSYGYRRGRSAADAIHQSKMILSRQLSPHWVLEGDIKSCFDTISHEWLEAHIPLEKRMLRQWLKAGFIADSSLQATEAGVPQGGIISPVIANMTLDGLEAELRKHYRSAPHQYNGATAKVNLVRYADDFIITGHSRELLEEGVKPIVEAFLKERGLKLSDSKTRITHIEEGFDFLGQNIRKYKGKLRVKPARENVRAFLADVKATIKAHLHQPPGQLIVHLNRKIRGWTNYHRHVYCSETFIRVDNEIFWAIWRWARRRHPKKGPRWVKKKYYVVTDRRKWVFFGDIVVDNKPIKLHLAWAFDTHWESHVKVRAAANPYDPEWEMYFEQRSDRKMLHDLKKRKKLRYLWRSQNGLCPVCAQKITTETGWHVHHIVWRAYGGGDEVDNLMLLHPNCHHQVHSRGLEVRKPRPAPGV